MTTPSSVCSEVCDPCEYNEHHKCSGYMHEGTRDKHWCMCPKGVHVERRLGL
jgi:hypothetical protein